MTKIPLSKFGKDHWSTLLYIESRVVDNKGTIDKRHMRCNSERHPAFGHIGGWKDEYSTRLSDGELVSGHDDWDCLYDMEEVGLVETRGTGVNPIVALTDGGWSVASRLRQHQGTGKGLSDFRFPVYSHDEDGSKERGDPEILCSDPEFRIREFIAQARKTLGQLAPDEKILAWVMQESRGTVNPQMVQKELTGE